MINRRDYSDFPALGVIQTPSLVHVEEKFAEDAIHDGDEAIKLRK
jgi:hypothetical protein